MHVSRLHAGVAISPSVVPLLAGYEHEHPVEQVPLPPETLIHFCNSACHCHVHEPVQGCSVVVVVVVDDVLLDVVVVLVVVLELVDDVVELVVLDDELEELEVVGGIVLMSHLRSCAISVCYLTYHKSRRCWCNTQVASTMTIVSCVAPYCPIPNITTLATW